jgi:hypothetical protein
MKAKAKVSKKNLVTKKDLTKAIKASEKRDVKKDKAMHSKMDTAQMAKMKKKVAKK